MVDIRRCLYSRGYRVTNEKLADYMAGLYQDGLAYEDDLSQIPVTFDDLQENTEHP